MPFTFKLSQRLARSRTAGALALVALAGCAPGDSHITGPSVDSSRNKYSAIASISVSPASASASVGDTARFTATAKDARGNTLTGISFAWSSSDPTVLTMGAGGLATGAGAGAASVVATAGGQQGTASVTVTAPPTAGAPGAVSDLAVTGATTTSLTLAFTEVDDGTGHPASYEVRAATGAMTWSSATPVASGTCASPLGGTTIGAARTCTVLGLTASTGYQVQLVAFRGTLDVDAVFGGLSNVAGGTTAAAAVAPVARVIVSPSSASGTVGQSAQFTATPQDSAGNPLTGRTVTWASSNTAVVTVTTAGYATAMGPGSASLIATSEGKSGSASVAVTGVSSAPVASVTVSPANASVGVGGAYQFSATLRDSAGNVLSGRPVTWGVSDPLLALVDAGGLVTSLLAGTVTVTATSEGHVGTATLTISVLAPPPPTGGGWPHEPAGAAAVSDNPFSSLTASGWGIYYNTNGYVTIGTDASAPYSPSSVIQFLYPVGFTAGVSPGMEMAGLGGQKRLYVGAWWKVSSPWQGNPTNVNKIQYVFTNSMGSMFMAMYGPPGGPYELRVFPQFSTSQDVWLTPNVNNVPVTLGTWHQLEWAIDYSGASGHVSWWMDGTLIGDYANVPFPSEGLAEYHLAPVWGGTSGVKTETDYYWYDHIHISSY
jgi:uncharacterized protein YjdB